MKDENGTVDFSDIKLKPDQPITVENGTVGFSI